MTAIDRQQQLQRLDDFIASSKEKLTSILSRLGWSIESVTNNVDNVVVCPFDEAHRVPEKSLDKHLQGCQWKAEGYGQHDLPLSIPSLPSGAPSSVKFDEQLQEEVIRNAKEKNPAMSIGVSGRLIPRTSDRLTAEFTREEKCAMYEYVIANTVEPDIGDDIADMNKPKSSNDAKSSSYLELLAQERNLKRRRAKYRGVHTNKKSQIEILREVVNQQMEMLAEYVAEKRNDDSNEYRTNDSFDKYSCKDHEENTKEPRSYSSNNDRVVSHKSSSIESNDRHDRYTRRPESSINQGRSTDNRRYHRSYHDSHDLHSHRKSSSDVKEASKERERSVKRDDRDSSEKRSHNSSHKRHRHKSKDRRERTRSREKRDERDNSRSSRDSKYDDRKWEHSRRSRHDDRKTKKRRSRSR